MKESFSSVLHLLEGAAVHQLARKENRPGVSLSGDAPAVSIQQRIHLAVK